MLYTEHVPLVKWEMLVRPLYTGISKIHNPRVFTSHETRHALKLCVIL